MWSILVLDMEVSEIAHKDMCGKDCHHSTKKDCCIQVKKFYVTNEV